MAELLSRARRVALLLFFLGLVGCDHATKLAAERSLAAPVSLARGVLELRLTRNDDTAFSFFHHLSVAPPAWWLVGVGALAMIGVAVAWLLAARRGAGLAVHAAYAMIAAGAVGNVVDRAARGYVVDFIHVTHWPVFNVADIAVVIGVGILLLATTVTSGPIRSTR